MTDYSKMSDFEINKEVLIKTQYYDDISDRQVKKDSAVRWGDGCNWHHFDPCNNPADSWPIIKENRIHLDPPLRDFHPWKADRGIAFQCQHDNPLRAAMVVFLKLKDYENAKS